MNTPNTRTKIVAGVAYEISLAHPAADAYDWMSDEQIRELADDIHTNGQKLPIRCLADGRIIDGRNRELACLMAGVNPDYKTANLVESEIVPFIESANLHRRHLSPDEQQHKRAERIARVATARARGESLATIAEREKVSREQVKRDIKASGVTGVTPEPKIVTGKDGKRYPLNPEQGTLPGCGDEPLESDTTPVREQPVVEPPTSELCICTISETSDTSEDGESNKANDATQPQLTIQPGPYLCTAGPKAREALTKLKRALRELESEMGRTPVMSAAENNKIPMWEGDAGLRWVWIDNTENMLTELGVKP